MNTTQTKLPKAIEKQFNSIMIEWIENQWQIEREHQNGNPYTRMKFESDANVIEKKILNLFLVALQTQTEEYRKRIEELNVYYQGDGDQPEIDYLKKSDVLNILKETK